jgi:ribosome biogenesis GTPase
VLAANVDVAFLVVAFGRDLSARRLERYLTLAWESGAEPRVVLTKADLSADPEADAAPLAAVAAGVPVDRTSSVTGEGLAGVRAQLPPGRTGALLGSSGTGKSTLANAFLGRPYFPTHALRRDDRGRHTTVKRELVVLPGGGLLVDTPGLRELQLWADAPALERTFGDVRSLAERCRFRDCAHDREPGCAVLAAVADGTLEAGRLAGFRTLQRELAALSRRRNAGRRRGVERAR